MSSEDRSWYLKRIQKELKEREERERSQVKGMPKSPRR